MTGHRVLDLAPRRSVVPHEHQRGAGTESGQAGAKGEGWPKEYGSSGSLGVEERKAKGKGRLLCYFLGEET